MLASPTRPTTARSGRDDEMTTMTTLNDVRAALIDQGYPAEQVDAMLNLAGRMILEGSLASKGDVAALRDEFTAFKIDVATQFAEMRAEMNAKFAEQSAQQSVELNEKIGELRVELNEKIGELRVELNEKIGELRVENARSENRIIKWVFGGIFAGVVLNTGIISLLLVVLPRLNG